MRFNNLAATGSVTPGQPGCPGVFPAPTATPSPALRSGDPVSARRRGTEFTAQVGQPVTFPGDYRTHDAPIDAS